MSDAQATPGLAGPQTYVLLFPVERRNKDGEVVESIRELTLNRLKAPAFRRCMNALEKGKGEFAFELICASAAIPPSTFNELDAEDVTNMLELAAPFLKSGQPT